jgi:hypothetical protein
MPYYIRDEHIISVGYIVAGLGEVYSVCATPYARKRLSPGIDVFQKTTYRLLCLENPVLWAGSEIKAMPDFCIPPHPIPLPQGGEGTMCPEILLLHPVGGDGRGEGGHPPLKPDPLGPVVYCFDYDRICFNG